MIERRRYLRVTEEDLITYKIVPTYKIAKGITEDLSVGGIRFFAKDFIPMLSILKVGIKLKHANREINAMLKVKWIKQYFDDERYDLGAEFIDISSEDIKFLNNYLSNRTKRSD